MEYRVINIFNVKLRIVVRYSINKDMRLGLKMLVMNPNPKVSGDKKHEQPYKWGAHFDNMDAKILDHLDSCKCRFYTEDPKNEKIIQEIDTTKNLLLTIDNTEFHLTPQQWEEEDDLLTNSIFLLKVFRKRMNSLDTNSICNPNDNGESDCKVRIIDFSKRVERNSSKVDNLGLEKREMTQTLEKLKEILQDFEENMRKFNEMNRIIEENDILIQQAKELLDK
eukprot:TRINITY_DN13546_c0_g1_i1.p2 TRINITY_DN13546_c0_g1~~TRINITY_DN13546_c0_g1_i1.p2  ORF type:complete len:223 (+),score=68.48 TRINITY_DN13546_c0_g1_i1:91-759(+)